MVNLPKYYDLLNPTLAALRSLGGSGSISEIAACVCESEKFSEKQQSVLHKDGPQTEIEYRLAWARTYLKRYGLLKNIHRGIWSLTPQGQETLTVNPTDVNRVVNAEAKKNHAITQNPEPQLDLKSAHSSLTTAETLDSGISDPSDSSDMTQLLDTLLDGAIPIESELWTEQLLEILLGMPSDAFERLCQRILRLSGFVKVDVTGRKGDGGIDGIGVLKVALLSFQVLFQCKRYRGMVGPGEIRDFRGAMVGRTDKGLFMTTGRFTRSAEQEATRDGAPAIELIDGQELCRLLANLQIGITCKKIEVVEIDRNYFQNL